MVKATIISPVRTPKGRLKGYHLDIAGADHFLLCEEIKERIASRTLSVSGMKVNSAGALILEAPSKEKPVIYDPLIIHSALELSKKVLRAAALTYVAAAASSILQLLRLIILTNGRSGRWRD